MTGIIYRAICVVNKKVYIGQTINKLKFRIYDHIYSADYCQNQRTHKFYNAIRKHKKENFTWEIVETIEKNDVEELFCELDSREKFWIDYYDSIKNGYNIVYGSSTIRGNTRDLRLFGADNPAYVEININEEEYFVKANEGLNRQQLADYFGIPDRHMKIWRKRMIAKDVKYKQKFLVLDSIRKKRSSEHNKVIHKYASHIEDIKSMRLNNISMRKISEKFNIPFSGLRRLIHRDL